MTHTWDGEPVAQEPPHGAAVVVTAVHPGGRRYLVLHRAHRGPAYEGDWAWTPPSGCRKPGEDIGDCAARELLEETGIAAVPVPLDGDAGWAVYLLEVAPGTRVTLDAEHDTYAWLPYAEAVERCAPEAVRANLRTASAAVTSTT